MSTIARDTKTAKHSQTTNTASAAPADAPIPFVPTSPAPRPVDPILAAERLLLADVPHFAPASEQTIGAMLHSLVGLGDGSARSGALSTIRAVLDVVRVANEHTTIGVDGGPRAESIDRLLWLCQELADASIEIDVRIDGAAEAEKGVA